MRLSLCWRALSGALVLLLALPVMAAEASVFPLMHRWARINYQMHGEAQEAAFTALADDAAGLAEAHPRNAEVLTWQGIILASEAGARGGLGALELARQARDVLERAIELDPQGDDGSAYVTLGTLYARVPGWPIGFGDDERAGRLLKKAVAIRPEGIDTLYFYAAFLHDQGRDQAALDLALRARRAPDRPGREASDTGLREAIGHLVAELR